MVPVRVLVVDNEPSIRTLLCATLERAGYVVAAVEGASSALEAMQHQLAFDIIVTDVMMPCTDGLTLLDALSADYPGTPVIFLSAEQNVHVVAGAFRRGAFDYLVKPFERAQLLDTIARASQHRQLRSQDLLYRQNLEDVVSARTSRLRQTLADLERSYDITLEAMGDALDLRDSETEGHSRRVTAYTIALARALGVEAADLRVIARGAFLHDIGKIATPDAILLKPGRLDDAERAIMREHCECGYNMVRKIPFLREAAEIVYAHQESFDGSGYPRGLVGEQIPLGARIFAIADTLDAITSDRPYRKGASIAEACSEIVRCAGRQFDPRLVAVFSDLPQSLWTQLREQTAGTAANALGHDPSGDPYIYGTRLRRAVAVEP